MTCLLVIIDDLDIDRAGRAVRPLEADPPLVIDADAILTLPITLQRFQPVTWQRGEVFQVRCGFQPVEPHFSLPGESGEFSNVLAIGKAFGSLVPVAYDHSNILALFMRYVKRHWKGFSAVAQQFDTGWVRVATIRESRSPPSGAP